MRNMAVTAWLCLAGLGLAVLTLAGPIEAWAAPTWRGLVPGGSTLQDVYVALGRPASTQSEGGRTYLFWNVTAPPGRSVITQNLVSIFEDKVEFIQVSDPADFESDPNKVMAQNGKPEWVSKSTFTENSRYYHYPSRGLSFMVDAGPNQMKPTVAYMMIYPPMGLDKFKQTFQWK